MSLNKPSKIGKRYGNIEVLDYLGDKVYRCLCHKCNKEFQTKTFNLLNGLKGMKMCYDCKKLEYKPLRGIKVGKIYGKLKVIEFLGNKEYLCECECGNKCIVKTTELRPDLGHRCTKSCGCDVIHYSKNEKFFEKIDTEEKAYFLGFMFSDGHLNDTNNNIKITLKSSDIDILEKLKEAIEYSGPITIKDIKTILPQGTVCYSQTAQLLISSKKIVEDLKKIGLNSRKSFEYDNIFSFDCIPKELRRHFVRGMWDGDGSSNIRRIPSGKITYKNSIINSTVMCNKMKKYIQEEFPEFNILVYNRNKESDYTSILDINGRKYFKNFVSFLYKDSNIYLDRKYKLFLANLKILDVIDQQIQDCKNKHIRINLTNIEINNKDIYL